MNIPPSPSECGTARGNFWRNRAFLSEPANPNRATDAAGDGFRDEGIGRRGSGNEWGPASAERWANWLISFTSSLHNGAR